MRRTLIKTLSLLLVVILTAAFALPALAAPFPTHELNEYDQEKLLAFWQQSAYDGMNNGEAVYDIHLPEGGYLFEEAPEYEGGYWTHLLASQMIGTEAVFNMYLYYTLEGWNGQDKADGTKTSPLVLIYPDLYGELDLCGTNIQQFCSYEDSYTHLTDFRFDDCTFLNTARIFNQAYANSFSAMGSKRLYWLDTTGSSFRSIDFDPYLYETPVSVMSFGDGAVEVLYCTPFYEEVTTLTAVPAGENFFGWYKDGMLVSSELVCEVSEGGNYRAVFGGDADGDGMITVSDAITALRMSMGVADVEPSDMDINGNGSVDIADAIMILKFAMGVL